MFNFKIKKNLEFSLKFVKCFSIKSLLALKLEPVTPLIAGEIIVLRIFRGAPLMHSLQRPVWLPKFIFLSYFII
ncbi:MAG: hypothetical protein COA94_08450 [Rickettsiales bacterium]|nr:MAG: hypothetical protein COA94_08450 [Rickettsiales bacterium]